MAFDEVAHDIETETAVRIGKRQVEHIVDGAAQDFDAFYAQPCALEVQQQSHAKPMQVLTFDGKGVVMESREMLGVRRPVASPAPQDPCPDTTA